MMVIDICGLPISRLEVPRLSPAAHLLGPLVRTATGHQQNEQWSRTYFSVGTLGKPTLSMSSLTSWFVL